MTTELRTSGVLPVRFMYWRSPFAWNMVGCKWDWGDIQQRFKSWPTREQRWLMDFDKHRNVVVGGGGAGERGGGGGRWGGGWGRRGGGGGLFQNASQQSGN